MATLYVDYEGGSDANNGTTFALRKKTLTSASSVAVFGDTGRLMASPPMVSMGNATWTNVSPTLTLATGRTANVYLDGAWTAATNVTATAGTTRREGATAASMAIAAGFTTGKIAHYDLGAATDFSAYGKIALWFRNSVAIANLSIYRLDLCSDTVGAVPLHQLTLPAIAAGANLWIPILLDSGGVLSNVVRSISIHATTDPGTVTILLDNLIATNDLWQGSIVSKNSAGEKWWAIRSINGTAITLEGDPQGSAATTPRGYVGTTETVTSYMREPIRVTPVTAAATDLFAIGTSGQLGNLISWSGGWNRTDMSTQTDFTWFSGQNSLGEGVALATRHYNAFSKMGFVRCDKGFLLNAAMANVLTDVECPACNNTGVQMSAVAWLNTLTRVFGNQSGTEGLLLVSGSTQNSFVDCGADGGATNGFKLTDVNSNTFSGCVTRNNATDGTDLDGSSSNTFSNHTSDRNGGLGVDLLASIRNQFLTLGCANNAEQGVRFSGSSQNTFRNYTSSGNTNGSVTLITTGSGINFFYNWQPAEATVVAAFVNYENSQLISVRHGGNNNDHRIFTDGCTILTSTSNRHTASGLCWEIKMASPLSRTATYPVKQRIAALRVKANVAVTASVWVRRQNASEISVIFRLPGGQIAGVPNDLDANAAATHQVYEQLSINFTPTEDGVIDFEIIAIYLTGTAGNWMNWDDFSAVSASTIDTSAGDYAYANTGAYLGAGAGGGGNLFGSALFAPNGASQP